MAPASIGLPRPDVKDGHFVLQDANSHWPPSRPCRPNGRSAHTGVLRPPRPLDIGDSTLIVVVMTPTNPSPPWAELSIGVVGGPPVPPAVNGIRRGGSTVSARRNDGPSSTDALTRIGLFVPNAVSHCAQSGIAIPLCRLAELMSDLSPDRRDEKGWEDPGASVTPPIPQFCTLPQVKPRDPAIARADLQGWNTGTALGRLSPKRYHIVLNPVSRYLVAEV